MSMGTASLLGSIQGAAGLEARSLTGDITRQTGDVLYVDGTTSNRRGEAVFGSAGGLASIPHTIIRRFRMPASDPSANAYFFAWCASGTSAPAAQNNSLSGYINTSGAIVIDAEGATAGTDYRRYTFAGARAAWAGKWVDIAVVFSAANSTTSPAVFISGVNVSALFALTTAGTPPTWVSASLDSTKYLDSYAWVSGQIVPLSPLLGTLSSSEVLEWSQTGRLPAWCQVGTGHTASTYTSDFSAGVDSWVDGGGGVTLTGNVDSIDGKDDNLEVSAVGSAKTFYISRLASLTANIGSLVSFEYYAEVGCGVAYLGVGTSTQNRTSSELHAVVEGAWTMAHLTTTPVRQTTSLPICGYANDAGTASDQLDTGKKIYVRGFTVRNAGPLARWVVQPVGTCYDSGTNKIPLLLTAGVTPITSKRDWIIQDATATNGNKQILSASVFVAPYDYTRHVLDDWCMKTAGTPTVTAGSASAGTEYKASAALAATRNMITLATRVVGTANIWVGSNGTDSIQHTIRGHIAD